MIMVLVSESQDKSKTLMKFFKEQSIDIVHYNSPMKALDNLAEIRPDAIVIDTIDFPRHWKVITQYVRYSNSRNDVVIILIVNALFSAFEIDKAVSIGVQGIINIDTPNEMIVSNAKDILAKYKSATFKARRDFNEEFSSDDCSFLFVEPETECIVTGKVKDLHTDSLLFIPDMKLEGINKDDILKNCSLKIRNKIIMPNCRVVEVNNYLNLEFVNLKEEEAKIIEDLLNESNELALIS
ncbi:MAG: hypothetical protein ACTTKH_01130 [Treponema sp.]